MKQARNAIDILKTTYITVVYNKKANARYIVLIKKTLFKWKVISLSPLLRVWISFYLSNESPKCRFNWSKAYR